MTPEQLDQVRRYASLQFAPAECEVGLGLTAGTLEGDQEAMGAYLQARVKAQAAARHAMYEAARNGDVRAAERFLELGGGLELEIVPDKPAKRRARK